MEVKRKKKGTIILSIIYLVLILTWFFLNVILISQNQELKRQVEFESLKEGLCVYIEYDAWQGYTYCLVYDEYINQIIEIDLFDELIHTKISVGDIIVYVVDYNYTDADFLNVIKGE